MLLLSLALVLDWFVGEPKALWKRVSHPVVLIGRFIDWADKARDREGLAKRFNLPQDRFELWAGGLLVLMLFAGSVAFASAVHSIAGPFWWLADLIVVAILVAQKSLKDHVEAVVTALKTGGIVEGREAVSMIVGRDVSDLDRSGVSKAAVESLAENFSDGIVAPVLWYAVAGLPGIVFYKAINTADSMVGHRSERHEFFGKAAAKVDDLMNWPAARLSALIISVACFFGGFAKPRAVLDTAMRDAQLHVSPNAGWPESAFAAALGVSLGGPRQYGERKVSAPYLNPQGRDELTMQDVSAALDLFRRCCFVLIGGCFLLAVLG